MYLVAHVVLKDLFLVVKVPCRSLEDTVPTSKNSPPPYKVICTCTCTLADTICTITCRSESHKNRTWSHCMKVPPSLPPSLSPSLPPFLSSLPQDPVVPYSLVRFACVKQGRKCTMKPWQFLRGVGPGTGAHVYTHVGVA